MLPALAGREQSNPDSSSDQLQLAADTMRQSNMSVLLSLLSFLLVTAARDGQQASLASAEGAVVPNSASTVMMYWQAMLPDSPMPLAILELLTPPNEAYRGVLHNGYTHGYRTTEQLHFVEDLLTPAGSMVNPYILPIATRAPFLRRSVADSIPMSTKNFNDILEAFAPVSLAMADGIWSTLDTCEHPNPIDGEKWACVTSIESMVELAMSELGTRQVRAISSDVPAEGIASGRYKVVEARTVTDSKAKTMTCHSMKFPYAVYYCHAINPTRLYAVTLRDEDGGAPEMEALALCHLDTSKFDRENPLFVKQHLKPGDAALCHFISRDTVLWVPAAGTHGGGAAAAAQ